MTQSPGFAALRRVAFGYLTDLTVAISMLLLGSRLWGVPVRLQTTPWAVHRLIDGIRPVAPTALWQTYNDVISLTLEALPHDVGGTPAGNALVVLRLIWVALASVPETLVAVYLQGDALQNVVALVALALGASIFGVLAAAAKGRGWRIALAALATLPLTSLSFGLLEWGIYAAVAVGAALDSIAPWWLACPILCSLWWVVFPGAARGAVASLLHALARPTPHDHPGLPKLKA